MINTSTVKIVANVAGFNRGINSAENKTQSFDNVVGKLKTTAISLGAAMLAAAGVNGVTAMIARSMQLQDAHAKLADRLGISTQSLAAFSLQADLTGVGSDKLEKIIQKMTVNLQDAAEGTGPAVDAVKKLGLNIYELASQSPDQAFLTIADATKHLTSETEKVSIAAEIFGERGVAVLNMLAEGREGLDAAAAKTQQFGTALNRVDAAKLEAANDAFRIMRESVDGLATRIAVGLSPQLQQMAENFAANATAMAKFFGFRTEEEQLNYLLAERAEIMARIEKIQKTTNDTLKIAQLRQSAAALRDEINVILDKQKAEAASFIASDKIRIAEEAATAKRLALNAQEIAASKNKKATIDAEIQAMRDRAAVEKELQAELTAELTSRAEWNAIYNEAEIQAIQYKSAAEEEAAVRHNQLVDEQMQLDQTAADSKRAMQESVAGNAIALMRMLGGKNKNWARAAVLLDKAMSIAKIKMATEVAAMNAAAAAAVAGPQAALAAAASMRAMGALSMGIVAAMGALELSNINTGGGSSASGAGTGGASGLSPYGAPPVSVPAMQQQSGSMTFYINGVITDDILQNLMIPAIQDAVQNRDVILIRNDSRNAQQLIT